MITYVALSTSYSYEEEGMVIWYVGQNYNQALDALKKKGSAEAWWRVEHWEDGKHIKDELIKD